MKHYAQLYLILVAGISLNAYAGESALCGDAVEPLLSTSDYNGDGVVDGRDQSMIARATSKGKYYALYDINADGVLNSEDVSQSAHNMGATSTPTDQLIAKMYQRFKHFQHVSTFDDIEAMGFMPLGPALQFHGQHWSTVAGQMAAYGLTEPNPLQVEGVNVLSDGSRVPALYWGQGAIPLFEDPDSPDGLSTLDWPSPTGLWNVKQVMAFANTPADFFPDADNDRWHAHAGLCVTKQDLGQGPEWVAQQHMTNAECQAQPNLEKIHFNGRVFNLWTNFWMLHVWLYDLNPNGLFGNTHPCVDPVGLSEEVLNEGRIVPPFFQHH